MQRRGFTLLMYKRVIVSNLLVRADVSDSMLSIRLFFPVRVLLDGVVPTPLAVRPDQIAGVIVSRRLALTAVLVPIQDSGLAPFLVSYWVAASFLPDLTEQAKRVGRFEAARFVRGSFFP